jgi:hypothetical protein
MKEPYAKAIKNSRKSAIAGKRYHDKRIHCTELQPGNEVDQGNYEAIGRATYMMWSNKRAKFQYTRRNWKAKA